MKVLILNQAFYPDVVSTGQHASDLARALVEAGHEVAVIASRRGYDDPARRFAPRERWQGIDIYRVANAGWGKGARWRRAVDFASFLMLCAGRVLLLPRFDVVIALTSPPLISCLAALISPLKRARMLYWTMDLNPDEAIAGGWLQPESLPARILSGLQQYSLRRADGIVVLDRFMQQRLTARGIALQKIAVVAPWAHDDRVAFDEAGREEFRRAHKLNGKFVVMYSGNHSPCHPLDTLLHAAAKLSCDPRFAFCFVGGGSEFRKVQQFASCEGLRNVICLPYQPLDKLKASLSAADLHVVVMGEAFTGIVHPCKIYNVLAVGAPLLYIGPQPSHVSDLLSQVTTPAFAVRHGDVAGVVEAVERAVQLDPVRRRAGVHHPFSRQELLPRMVAAVEQIGHDIKPATQMQSAA